MLPEFHTDFEWQIGSGSIELSQGIQNSKLDELSTHLRQTQDFGLRVCQVREKEVVNEYGNQRKLLSGSLFFEAFMRQFSFIFCPQTWIPYDRWEKNREKYIETIVALGI